MWRDRRMRPDDGQRTLTKHQTVMREEYAETGERGFGLAHEIVRLIIFYKHLHTYIVLLNSAEKIL